MMKFSSWFWMDDTNAWSRKAGAFLRAATVLLLLLGLGVCLWSTWAVRGAE